jgi:polycystin 1L2
LGLLNYIHIWHDNTGEGASGSWFLKYIIVRDLQTMEKSYFICQKWFAVEKGDGIVSFISNSFFPVNKKHQIID